MPRNTSRLHEPRLVRAGHDRHSDCSVGISARRAFHGTSMLFLCFSKHTPKNRMQAPGLVSMVRCIVVSQ